MFIQVAVLFSFILRLLPLDKASVSKENEDKGKQKYAKYFIRQEKAHQGVFS